MSNKTAIQTIIDEMELALTKVNKKSLDYLMQRTAIRRVIKECKDKLPAEKQMIMDAYQAGFEQDIIGDVPETYYNETFKTT